MQFTELEIELISTLKAITDEYLDAKVKHEIHHNNKKRVILSMEAGITLLNQIKLKSNESLSSESS